MSFFRVSQLFCVFSLALYTAVSNAHSFKPGHAEHQFDSRFSNAVLEERNAEPGFQYNIQDENGTSTKLYKRNLYNLNGNSQADESILGQAFLDMQALVTYVAQNPNPQVLARYFDPNHANDVNAIFNTVMAMASTNPPTTPPGQPQLTPMDLHEINVVRASGSFPTLAESFRTSAQNNNLQIKVYDFGWTSLYSRLRQNIACGAIGPNTNYRMHFLGSVLLHETLHFNNVAIQAWNQNLQPNQCPDDQPGTYPCFNLAYGPYESMKLLARDPNAARINIENYVWYALETYWLHECPLRAPGVMWTAAKSNDIPTVCKKLAVGSFAALANLWCWKS